MHVPVSIENHFRRPIQSFVPRRHSQIGKAAVCKTVYSRFKSGCRLHPLNPFKSRASGGIGRHDGLKIRCPQGHEGSSPSSPTKIAFKTKALKLFSYRWHGRRGMDARTASQPEYPLSESCSWPKS